MPGRRRPRMCSRCSAVPARTSRRARGRPECARKPGPWHSPPRALRRCGARARIVDGPRHRVLGSARASALDFSRARLAITWDDRAEPSVDAPVALFFGAGILYNRDDREYLVKSLPMVVRYAPDRVYLSCYFPMPFFRSAAHRAHRAPSAALRDVGWSGPLRAIPRSSQPGGLFPRHLSRPSFARAGPATWCCSTPLRPRAAATGRGSSSERRSSSPTTRC